MQTHWDLMLQQPGTASLQTWCFIELPRTTDGVTAQLSADHRKDYLTYEGAISGGRGEVRRVAAGSYVRRSHGPDRFELTLQAEDWHAVWRFQQIDSAAWQVTSHPVVTL